MYKLDVLNVDGDKIGEKTISPKHDYLNGWFKRPKGTVPAVPLSSSINEFSGRSRPCDVLSAGAFGYAMLHGNDPQHSTLPSFFSTAAANGHGTSITPDLFERIMVQVAVRRAIKGTWINWCDQFQIPHTEPSPEFVAACAVFNLFSGHNQTSEFTADYKGKNWKIKNEFFPFDSSLPKNLGPQTLAFQRLIPTQNTFVRNWLEKNLKGKAGLLWPVHEAALEYYTLFFQNYANVNRKKWKIEGANPGWYQIRNAMKEAGIGEDLYAKVREAVKELQEWIVPRVYEYGFLEPEMLYEEEVEE